MKPVYPRNLQAILLILLLNIVILSSCIDGEKARERQELTKNYGPKLEIAYYDHMKSRVEACQTQNVQGLDEFAEGRYLELLEQRVKESECYVSESFHEDIRSLSVNEYTPVEAEALITVDTADDKTYMWIVTFRQVDETWKITDIRNLPRDE